MLRGTRRRHRTRGRSETSHTYYTHPVESGETTHDTLNTGPTTPSGLFPGPTRVLSGLTKDLLSSVIATPPRLVRFCYPTPKNPMSVRASTLVASQVSCSTQVSWCTQEIPVLPTLPITTVLTSPQVTRLPNRQWDVHPVPTDDSSKSSDEWDHLSDPPLFLFGQCPTTS